MKKSAIVFIFAALFTVTAMAQTVQEGIGHWYAERYQSARSAFEKLTAANPNNLEAVYWLGQTLIAQDDIAGAKALYQKTLAANGNAPWVLVGMGEVNLIEGKAAEARQQFEAAINASKGKKGGDPAILAAVGRANIQHYSDDKKIGDIEYAIAKLNEAAQQAPNNADVFVALGNAYRKKHNGSEAVLAYRKAGSYAPALFRTASIYETQRNWEAVVEYLNATVAADAKFAPAYEKLYYYNLIEKRDFPTAESFGKLYVTNSDPSVENDYILAQTKFVQNQFQDAITIANKIVQQTNGNPKPRVFRLLAYSNLGLKDTAKACEYSNSFLTKASEEDLLANDFILHANTCGVNNPAIVQADISRALGLDTVLSHQLLMLSDLVKTARANKQYNLEAQLMYNSHELRGASANPADLFYIGTRFYYGNNFEKADTVLSGFITAFPDSVDGYYWRALTRSQLDSGMIQGLAVPDFEKTVQLSENSKERFKSQAAQAAQLLALYYNNIKKDRAAAQAIVAKGLEFDPENTTLKNLSQQLGGSKPTTPSKSETKSKTTMADGTEVKTKTKTKNA
ncbi:MAG: tetratricopeptide repeat protein [Chitinophagaceae bacterium]|nr:MAG: tetratricopeptide repeat protein [Chitinophagaceae bacterium]